MEIENGSFQRKTKEALHINLKENCMSKPSIISSADNIFQDSQCKTKDRQKKRTKLATTKKSKTKRKNAWK